MVGRQRGSRRTWIKLHTLECLEGSIRYQLEPDERGVWYDLLVFSAVCRNDGVISDRDGRAYLHAFIANRLNIDPGLLEKTLAKCLEEGRIKEDGTGIKIVNWKSYQSEYERQRPYRERRLVLSGVEGVAEERRPEPVEGAEGAKMSEAQKVGMTRSLINQHPDIAVDVLTRDFGHKVVTPDGEILGDDRGRQ